MTAPPLWAANGIAWAAQVAVLAVAALLLPRLLGLRQPRLLLPLGQGLLVLVLLLPWIQPRRPQAGAVVAPDLSLAASPALSGAGARTSPWPILAWLLAGGSVARLAWFAAGLAGLARLRRGGRPLPAAPEAWIRVCAELGMAPPPLLVSERVAAPVGFGLRRPIILLPASFATLPEPLQRAVLGHEAVHVRRRDWAATVAEEAARALLWFHPGVALLVARLRLWREQVVDGVALAATGDRGAYVAALLHFAPLAGVPAGAPTAAFLRRHDLEQRVTLLVEEKAMPHSRPLLRAAAFALALTLAAFAAAALLPLRAVAGEKEETKGEVTLPRVVEKVDPDYPAALREERAEGTVVVTLSIDAEGRVTDAEVEESPRRAFSAAAREALRRWRFEPARQDGQAVASTLTITIKFRLS